MNGLHEFDLPSLNGALAANAVHNTAAYDTGGSPSGFREFGAFFSSEAGGATNGAKIEASYDGGTTWKTVATGTLAANAPLFVSAPVVAKHMRASYTNGAAAATGALVQVFRRRN